MGAANTRRIHVRFHGLALGVCSRALALIGARFPSQGGNSSPELSSRILGICIGAAKPQVTSQVNMGFPVPFDFGSLLGSTAPRWRENHSLGDGTQLAKMGGMHEHIHALHFLVLAGSLLIACEGDPNFSAQDFTPDSGMPDAAFDTGPLERHGEEVETAFATETCAPRMARYPVQGPHNTGWDRSCLGGPCPVSCPDERANSDRNVRTDNHHGIDIFARRGAPLVAVADGTIVAVGVPSPGNPGSGTRVRLRDDCGWEYYYGHMEPHTVRVTRNQRVRAGDQLGTMGDSGTGGVHLHFNVSPNGGYSNDIDPIDLLIATSPTACGGAPAPTPAPAPAPSGGSVSSTLAFDATFYLGIHADLAAAFGNDAAAARRHYDQHGLGEGRRASPEFDPRFYLATHADVRAAYGANNFRGARDHFLQYGAGEGRAGSPEFNGATYLATYADLRQAFGARNYAAGIDHYRRYGLGEGRRASASFDPRAYLQREGDLRSAFGTDHAAALIHWVRYGRAEGRNGRP